MMKFSKKTRYGLIALIDLAVNSQTEQISLSSIARRNGISLQYLEQIFASLRRAGIVKSVKGSQGGYRLNRFPDKITIAQIIEVLEGNYTIETQEIYAGTNSPGITRAIQETIIDKINQQLDEILKTQTLEDLQKKYLETKDYDQSMYYI